MHIADALQKFGLQLHADGRSCHTIAQYARHVRLLARWLAGQGHSGDVEDVDHEDLARFLTSAAARTRPDGGVKRATSVNALRSSLRVFFGYLHLAGITKLNAARLVRRARCGAPPPRTLSERDQQLLLHTMAQDMTPAGRRDHALFHLLLATGIRLGSALALERRDVQLGQRQLTLHTTKGDQPQVVYLGRQIAAHLKRHLEGRQAGPVFSNGHGQPLTRRHAHRRLALWLERAGISTAASPHVLRHTFAIGLYRRTGDVLLVQAALGHRSLASSLVYARADGERLREAVAGC